MVRGAGTLFSAVGRSEFPVAVPGHRSVRRSEMLRSCYQNATGRSLGCTGVGFASPDTFSGRAMPTRRNRSRSHVHVPAPVRRQKEPPDHPAKGNPSAPRTDHHSPDPPMWWGRELNAPTTAARMPSPPGSATKRTDPRRPTCASTLCSHLSPQLSPARCPVRPVPPRPKPSTLGCRPRQYKPPNRSSIRGPRFAITGVSPTRKRRTTPGVGRADP